MVEAESTEAVRRFGFEDDVRRPDETAAELGVCLVVKVEHDVALADVVMPPPHAVVGITLVIEERSDPPGPVTARRLDQDHFGPHLPE
jgi:hypothetical protein